MGVYPTISRVRSERRPGRSGPSRGRAQDGQVLRREAQGRAALCKDAAAYETQVMEPRRRQRRRVFSGSGSSAFLAFCKTEKKNHDSRRQGVALGDGGARRCQRDSASAAGNGGGEANTMKLSVPSGRRGQCCRRRWASRATPSYLMVPLIVFDSWCGASHPSVSTLSVIIMSYSIIM